MSSLRETMLQTEKEQRDKATLHGVCPSCGCVIVPGHPGVRSIQSGGETIWICKWDHSRLALKAKAVAKA